MSGKYSDIAGYFLLNTFDFATMLRYFGGLMEPRKNKGILRYILYALFLITFSALIKYELPYCNLVSISIWSCLFLVMYKAAMRNKLVYSAILLGCAGFAQMIMHFLAGNQSLKAYIYFIPHFIFFIVMEVIGRFQTIKGKSIDPSIIFLLVSIPIASLIAMPCLVLIESRAGQLPLGSSVELVVISIIILYMNIVVFYLYDLISTSFENGRQKDDYEKQIQLQETYYELLAENQNVVRKIKHDMHNHLLLIEGLIDDGRFVEAKDCLNRLIDEQAKVKKIIDTGNEAIDAILNIKFSAAEELGIKLKSNINIPSSLPISYQDCIKVFGNLLDNSIDAVKNASAEKKRIDLLLNYKINALIFHIANPIDDHAQNKKEDADAHGFGLNIVKAAVEAYNGSVNVEDRNGEFVVNLVMYLNV